MSLRPPKSLSSHMKPRDDPTHPSPTTREKISDINVCLILYVVVFSLLSHENELARRAHTTGPNQRTKPNQHRSPNTCHGGLRKSSSVYTRTQCLCCYYVRSATALHAARGAAPRAQYNASQKHTLLLTLRHPVLCQHLL